LVIKPKIIGHMKEKTMAMILAIVVYGLIIIGVYNLIKTII